MTVETDSIQIASRPVSLANMKAMNIIRCLEHVTSADGLREQGLFSLEAQGVLSMGVTI